MSMAFVFRKFTPNYYINTCIHTDRTSTYSMLGNPMEGIQGFLRLFFVIF